MADETIENQEQVADEQVTEEQTEEAVVESTEKPEAQDDPLRLSPELQSRYKSAADLETFAAQKQSEADRLRSELDTYKQQHPTAESTQPIPNEEQLERLGRDPVRFVQEVTGDIRAQVALMEFSRLHPDMEQHKAGMKEIVERNPQVLAHPQGLEMAYLLAKSQGEATKLTQAAAVKQAHTAEVNAVKQTGAFVEGATTPKQKASPKISADDSVADMDKKLDAMDVGWISDEDRHSSD